MSRDLGDLMKIRSELLNISFLTDDAEQGSKEERIHDMAVLALRVIVPMIKEADV